MSSAHVREIRGYSPQLHAHGAVGVVVPVHDEEALLGACLDGLRVAARTVAGRARVRVVCALDACTDASEGIARRHGVDVVRLGARNVGCARATGCDALLEEPVAWLATTDADSVVDPGWLAAQLDAHDAGWDARVGTVHVADWGEHPAWIRARFHDAYDAVAPGGPDRIEETGPHPHVHGANLGVRATAYRAVGGFPALRTGEDVALVGHLQRAGRPILRTRSVPVRTSARTEGRAVDGFAAHLRGLGSVAAPLPTCSADATVGVTW